MLQRFQDAFDAHAARGLEEHGVARTQAGAQPIRGGGGIRRGAAGFDITFLHPKGNEEFPIGGEGVLVELVQAPPEVIVALG